MATVRIALDEVVGYCDHLEDPRSDVNQKHPLVSVVVIGLMAVLAGSSGPAAIAEWAHDKRDFLSRVLDLPNGVPRKDVFRRVLSLINPAAFQACFAARLAALRDRAAAAAGIDQPVFTVDGKTLRRSHDRRKSLGALHSVSVRAKEFGLSLGEVARGDKSNEITAIPELLRLVDIRGAIITIDAMGTQRAIAGQIVEQGADYFLALTGNQETLHNAVVESIDGLVESDCEGVDARRHTTTETGHGREETRCYTHLPVPRDLPGRGQSQGIQSIGVAITACTRDGNETIEKRYYLSSLPVGVKRFARAVRGHWGIENSCRWAHDMTFREDESRIRNRRIRENFAWSNRFVLSLLKQHPSRNSVIGKRRGCAWNDDFLLQVLMGKGG